MGFCRSLVCFYSDREKKTQSIDTPPYLVGSSRFPFDYPKEMASHWCECDRCGGKAVSKTTWYAHNPKRKHCVWGYRCRTVGASAGVQGDSSQNMGSSPPGDVDMKVFFPEDPEDEESQFKTKRVPRSDLVGAIR